jgi:hypothetical protein
MVLEDQANPLTQHCPVAEESRGEAHDIEGIQVFRRLATGEKSHGEIL